MMVSQIPHAFPAKLKQPKFRLPPKYQRVMPLRDIHPKSLEELMDDSDLLLKSDLSLITLISLTDLSIPVEEKRICDQEKINMFGERRSNSQKKRSKLVNTSSNKRSAVLSLDRNALTRMRSIEEPKLRTPLNHDGKLRLSKQKKKKSQSQDKKNLRLIPENHLYNTNGKRSNQIHGTFSEADYHCVGWMTQNLIMESKSQKNVKH